MSNRAGYSADFMEELGKCRTCGGSKSYPMLVDCKNDQQVCQSYYHSLRYQVASFIFKFLTGKEPAQYKEKE
jgi:hypothetical protein